MFVFNFFNIDSMGKKGVEADPSFHRLNYLVQLSLQCESHLGSDCGMSRYLAYTMRRGVALRTVNRLSVNVKRVICRRCLRFLRVHDVRLRLRGRPPHVMGRCRGCGYITRRPVGGGVANKRKLKRRRNKSSGHHPTTLASLD